MNPINNIPTLVQIMAWRRPGDKPLFEPMMVQIMAWRRPGDKPLFEPMMVSLLRHI